ncbi:MAG: hypothetical protein BWY09_01395 [Candidatus Hydrogenedentes bacterium ADurb.Bin179]|nr:MAG: hypothetical protein BWY09_01395 [Candidatus Hydrogenedentes bacterium ADurb.Bin179]
METKDMSIEDVQKTLLKEMTAGSPHEESFVIHFSNDDVDKYLKLLDRYENQPSKNLILVK